MTRILQADKDGIDIAASVLRTGELVVIPTETVYGLAANALDESACRRIFDIKCRPFIDPLIVHVAEKREARKYCYWNESAESLAEAFWPGSLTLVLPKKDSIPDIVTAGLPSVALRVPGLPVSLEVLKKSGLPLAAPSANPFGYVSPTCADHVLANLGSKVPYLLDNGPCPVGVESTIVDLRNPAHPVLLRPGAVTRNMIESILGHMGGLEEDFPKNRKTNDTLEHTDAKLAPGMMHRHYSPRTDLHLLPYDETSPGIRIQELADHNTNENHAYVFFSKPADITTFGLPSVYWLTENGSLEEAAKQVFALLHRLDGAGYKRIQFEMAPENDLGCAINNRLKRAASR